MLSWLFPKREHTEVVAQIENGPGTFAIEAVGESNYQEALEQVCGGRTDASRELEVTAYLHLEEDNPYDRKAVRVDVDGMTVGYLSRENAREFRTALREIDRKVRIARCRGLIVGGWDRGPDDRGHFGIRLDLPTG